MHFVLIAITLISINSFANATDKIAKTKQTKQQAEPQKPDSYASSLGPIEWSYTMSDTSSINPLDLKPLPYTLNNTMQLQAKENKTLGIQCAYHISSAWLGQRNNIYVEAMKFFCEDKKTGNVFDYGTILQCDNSGSGSSIASPAIYNTNDKKLKILNLHFRCRSKN